MKTTTRTHSPFRRSRLPIAAALALLLSTAPALAHDVVCERPLLHLKADGSVASGSRQQLIDSPNSGHSVRVRWRLGPSDILTHWAEPTFISIFEGNVFAQLPPIHVQRGIGKTRTIELYGDKAEIWYGLIATDGQLSGRHGEDAELESSAVDQTWCEAP